MTKVFSHQESFCGMGFTRIMCTTGLLPVAMVLRCRGAICNLQYTDPLKVLHYNVGGVNSLKCCKIVIDTEDLFSTSEDEE